MLEYLFDVSDVSQLTTFYISVLLSLSIQYIFFLSVDVSIDSFSSRIDIKSHSCIPSYIAKSRSNTNFLLTWIIKYIRKKESADDEGDHFIFSYK
ncbi:hypothetical protein PB1_11419 [Bacillus methanolicus PB1]|uniref:Uncharacterized protein n=1 Tax=Bacillus methanolicus PB1 TaxID=997296 RepID=I3DV95_BACMT|nr:hypothetical protein PB1_11419 [Bacillus methanolicus PB1]